MPVETTVVYMKAAGAVMGSSIALVFNDDNKTNIALRFLIGTIIGFISSPVIIDWLKWQHTADYWLAAATLGGLFGYLTLQIIFSDKSKEIIRKRLGK